MCNAIVGHLPIVNLVVCWLYIPWAEFCGALAGKLDLLGDENEVGGVLIDVAEINLWDLEGYIVRKPNVEHGLGPIMAPHHRYIISVRALRFMGQLHEQISLQIRLVFFVFHLQQILQTSSTTDILRNILDLCNFCHFIVTCHYPSGDKRLGEPLRTPVQHLFLAMRELHAIIVTRLVLPCAFLHLSEFESRRGDLLPSWHLTRRQAVRPFFSHNELLVLELKADPANRWTSALLELILQAVTLQGQFFNFGTC
mmetsp:Transcript_50376/g.92265  ORF Transcript_50376/g.92265 Transcript_50376/m.92265 type:complete len:254 (-) Transcript_50376:177-938(-)